MGYKSIVVNLDIDGPIVPVVKAALDLTRRFEARLIGVCAADIPLPIVEEEGSALAAELWAQMRMDVEKRLNDLRAEFKVLTAGSIQSEWRADVTNPTHAIVAASRLADLVVMAAREGPTGNTCRVADPASVVLRAGRPLLVVKRQAEQVLAKKVVVAWKDTREARRAVADSIPLLTSADEVVIVTVVEEADQWARQSMTDVVAFLAAHGIKAKTNLIENPDERAALLQSIDECDADLVVSGAYGHSRLREWVFGGITRSILRLNRRNLLMSS